MPSAQNTRNRGPAAAAANRAAILSAAKEVFATSGYRVPLSAVAKAAGVGQAVLYRHFPDRLELAYAVFAENFDELERVRQATPGPECFSLLWQGLLRYTVGSNAFIELVVETRSRPPVELGEERLVALIDEPLRRAQDAQFADPSWTPRDVLLMLNMVHGLAIAHPDPAETVAAVRRGTELLDPRLAAGLPTQR